MGVVGTGVAKNLLYGILKYYSGRHNNSMMSQRLRLRAEIIFGRLWQLFGQVILKT